MLPPPYKSGFTLAEVLITLVIIGVIAAITVPTIIVKYQQEQTVTRLKKAYSSLSQTTQKAIVDNGSMKSWEYSSTIDFVNKYMLPYLDVNNNCLNNNSIIKTGLCKFEFKYLNKKNATNTYNHYYRFLLSDGTLVAINCYNEFGATICGVFFDINGNKAPNLYGRDVFRYIYWVRPNSDKNSVYSRNAGSFRPTCMGVDRQTLLTNNDTGCNKNDSTREAGQCCAALIMNDSWQIKGDYPW